MCSIDGCSEPVKARGWCKAHYLAWYQQQPRAKAECSVDGCSKPVQARGWCPTHLSRWYKTGDPLRVERIYRDDPARLAKLTDRSGGPDACWPWLGYITDDGYGRVQIRRAGGGGKSEGAHRWSYALLVGPIPPGMHTDHECHNRATDCEDGPSCRHRRCINPAHLVLRTPRENTMRGRSPAATRRRQRSKSECPSGHAYDEANTYVHPATGYRWCRKCRANRERQRRLREVNA